MIGLLVSWMMALPNPTELNVNCTFRDCLGQGWQITASDGYQGVLNCEWGDCNEAGWRFNDNRGVWTRAECKSVFSLKGCLKYGFKEKDMKTGKTLAEVDCFGSDCLVSGMKIKYSNGLSAVTSCNFADCDRYGWDIKYSNGEIWSASCKVFDNPDELSCFKDGWILKKIKNAK